LGEKTINICTAWQNNFYTFREWLTFRTFTCSH